MTLHCLDSDFVIEILAGDDRAAALLRELEEDPSGPAVSAITVFEVTNDLRRSRRASTLEALGTLEILPVDGSVSIAASQLGLRLRGSGREVPMADLLIAATCLLRRIPLVTRNAKHFGRIRGLKIVSW